MDYILKAETGFLGLEIESEKPKRLRDYSKDSIIYTYDIKDLLKNMKEREVGGYL